MCEIAQITQGTIALLATIKIQKKALSDVESTNP
jgi:hypothetical protein